jgi:hypothetical protein
MDLGKLIRKTKMTEQSTAKCLDNYFDFLDDLLLKHEFETVGQVLMTIIDGKPSNVILIGLWTITFPWKEQLGDYYKKLKEHILETERDHGRTKKEIEMLYRGLR